MLDSTQYWINRYREGKDSGSGSDGDLGRYKANAINSIIRGFGIKSIVDHGCGDGKFLHLLELDGVEYKGYDVSGEAISRIRGFNVATYDKYEPKQFDLSISIDVLFHLIKDDVYDAYMRMLFNDGNNVLIYGYDSDEDPMIQYGKKSLPHMKYRKFSDWIKNNTDFGLTYYIPNRFPYNPKTRLGSICSFYLYTYGV